jgi:hypothetical protein
MNNYDRPETSEELALLRSIYANLRLYINFFQPILKLTVRPFARQIELRHHSVACWLWGYPRGGQSPFDSPVYAAELCQITAKVAQLWKFV